MRRFIVLTAAGSGSRLGANTPKALVPLAGRPLLTHALEGLPDYDALVVNAPASHLEDFRAIVSDFDPAAIVVPGGLSRQESVLAALRALREAVAPLQNDDLVLVHDAARPFTPATVFDRVVAALQNGYLAVIPAVPVTDTVKIVTPPTQPGEPVEPVSGTPDRATLRAVQTPQGFRLAQLLELHERFAAQAVDESVAFSDDASLFEAAGLPVVTVPGDAASFKITTPYDLAFAEFQLSRLR